LYKPSEIKTYIDNLTIDGTNCTLQQTQLQKWLYLEKLVQRELELELTSSCPPSTIRNYYQVTAYFNYEYFSRVLTNCQLNDLAKVNFSTMDTPNSLVYYLSIYGLLAVPELGIPDRQLEDLRARTYFYVTTIRSVLIKFLEDAAFA